MPKPADGRPDALLAPRSDTPRSAQEAAREAARETAQSNERRGFGGAAAGEAGRRRGKRKRGASLSRGDWGPLGKHPDLDAIMARQRLRLPLSGRLSAAQVNQAWKRCAGEHHPDRGGEHDTMQLVNGARDLLLGRDIEEPAAG
jgi:hypothetical protein